MRALVEALVSKMESLGLYPREAEAEQQSGQQWGSGWWGGRAPAS